MESVVRQDFGTLLRQFRLEAGITQQELAERAKLSIEAIGTLERGARKRPQRATVALLARALNLMPQRREALLASAASVRHPSQRAAPGDALHESYLRIVRSEPQAIHTNNLALQLTSFVGRRSELAEISALLQAHRLVTIVGSGGVGKSRIAVQLGGDQVPGWQDGVWLVELAPLSDPTLVASTVSGALHVPLGTSASALNAVVAYLKARHVLLILDNCEHVVAEARDLVTNVAQWCPHVRILSTSREPLSIPGERVYRLPSLAVPPDSKLTVQDALLYESVALFADRARAVDGNFALTDNNAPAVGDICRRLDGIPLAIELAAARVNVLAPGQIAKRLDERFRLLTGGDPRSLPRHQTMLALIDWSYDLLSPRERQFFGDFSVFAGGCTLYSATAVCANDNEDDLDVLNLVESLVAKSLLLAGWIGGDQRYYLLESSRQYARNKLAARGMREALAERHAVAYLDLAEQLEDAKRDQPDDTWLLPADEEQDNWRAALEWSLGGRNDAATGQRLAAALCELWSGKAVLREGRRWAEVALQTVDRRALPALAAKLELAKANMDLANMRLSDSLSAGERALALYQQLDDPVGIGWAQNRVATALAYLGQTGEAENLLVEALSAARSLNERRLAAEALENLAGLRVQRGDVAAARPLYAEANALWEAAGRQISMYLNALLLAEAEFRAGETQAALRYIDEALEMSRADDRRRIRDLRTWLLANRAAYLTSLGRYDEAIASACEALGPSLEGPNDPIFAINVQHVAAAATLRPYDSGEEKQSALRRAAHLLGFVNARLAQGDVSRPEYTEQQEYDRMMTALRGEFGADELAQLIAAGALMSEESVISEARAVSQY